MAVQFPDPESADEQGLLAVGGNLEPETLLKAYKSGIFPWYAEGQPIFWWSPDPRMILYPGEFRISHSLKQTLHKPDLHCTFDTSFPEVIRWCSKIEREGQEGTWLTPEMIKAYTLLHKMGYAHSVETWFDGKLAGGLYGIAIGRVFFGESMFHLVRDASKVALYYLVQFLKINHFELIDVQQSTAHLRHLGAIEISRSDFLEQIKKACAKKGVLGKWHTETEPRSSTTDT